MSFTKVNAITTAVNDRKRHQKARLFELEEKAKDYRDTLKEIECSIAIITLDLAELDDYREDK